MGINELARLMTLFQSVIERLGRCKRWEGYPTPAYLQSSLHHSFMMPILTAYCVRRERELGGATLDEAQLLLHASIHDFDESQGGDVTYWFKNHPAIKFVYEELELESTMCEIAGFGPLSGTLREAYFLTPDSLEADFFDAVERIDYLLYALSEYKVYNNVAFVAVFARQDPKLKAHAGKFKVVAEIYNKEVQTWVTEQIAAHPDEAKKALVPPPGMVHVELVVSALRDLIQHVCSSPGMPTRASVIQCVREAWSIIAHFAVGTPARFELRGFCILRLTHLA